MAVAPRGIRLNGQSRTMPQGGGPGGLAHGPANIMLRGSDRHLW